MNRLILITVLCACAAAASGCLFNSKTTQRIEGQYVEPASFGQIKPGQTTATWVLATLGEPSSRTTADDQTEVWKWTYTEHRHSSGNIFILFAAVSDRAVPRSAFVELRDGVVTRKWRS
jgi:outer membrane protein assembly factor BamE (lipoprotein component of BamABCDE complex)